MIMIMIILMIIIIMIIIMVIIMIKMAVTRRPSHDKNHLIHRSKGLFEIYRSRGVPESIVGKNVGKNLKYKKI